MIALANRTESFTDWKLRCQPNMTANESQAAEFAWYAQQEVINQLNEYIDLMLREAGGDI